MMMVRIHWLVYTGTVLFSTTTLYSSTPPEISRATDSTYDRSASPLSVGGVPTATKITELRRSASFRSSENVNRCPRCRFNNSGKNFSWIGTWPSRSAASFFWSLSTRMTSCPRSAKQAPATNPTYPEPTTAMRIGMYPSETGSSVSAAEGWEENGFYPTVGILRYDPNWCTAKPLDFRAPFPSRDFGAHAA